MKPFLKWVGGKTRLYKHILPLVPEKFKNYHEPFFGGGAIFLKISEDHKSFLNDLNKELIETYKQIKINKYDVISLLKKYRDEDSSQLFYELREKDRDGKLWNLTKPEIAARMIYLNHACYGGLYRVNSKGEFNVPYAKKINGKEILNEQNLNDWSKKLKNASLFNSDFEKFIKTKVKSGDFVFIDPPYFEWSASANFTSYTKEGFGYKDQLRLLECLRYIDSIGAKFILTNSGTNEVKEFYKEFNMKKVPVVRTISSKASTKSGYFEYIVYNY